MSAIKNVKKIIPMAMIIGSTLLGGSAYGQSVEMMSGNKGSTIDTKFSTELPYGTGLFFRDRISVGTNKNVNYFGLMDISKRIGKGLDAVAEFQFSPGMPVDSRVGIQYYKSLGDFSVYSLGTSSLSKNSNNEILVNLRYAPKLNKNLEGVINLENITNFELDKHNFSIQRARMGLKKGKYEFGLAADLGESEGKVSKNIGVYGKITF